ncbi:hypothetical protein ABID21_002437 [Pseudorhizobium tarimense]|uniref:Lipoprotein n=1 Tax=Pseudorhizobium tarimense TaxID=1079109 RepID=A0ABV2H715_9HYPH|nr:hypothetical protein [Pseudorhizobium tarimense]MCJ8519346.1 hypothetical protein [Pseudorhizobium tarimense]
MRGSATALCATLFSLALTACNTTDALTPQVDVGGGLRPSTPVTQAEADVLAGADRQVAYQSESVEQPRHLRPPQNTLEAQAQALEAGQTSPSASGPEAFAPLSRSAAAAPPPAPAAASPSQVASLPSTAAGTIRFLPIIGAPVQSVTPLSRQLGAQARAAGLSIRASGDVTADHILKGYFSAFGDASAVTVVYVWDILDNSGARLHRLQGQVQVPTSAKDPWAAVPPSTMETIATKTINEYVAWKQSQTG